MKSGGFHVKSKDLLQGIVTLCSFSLRQTLVAFDCNLFELAKWASTFCSGFAPCGTL